jgi:hypothetical protein
MTNLPTPRGPTVQSMLDHLKALFPRLEEILDHHATKKQRNMRFTSYSRKEKAMEAMVERIAPRKEKTLAVYGAADFPHAMKGVQITYVPEDSHQQTRIFFSFVLRYFNFHLLLHLHGKSISH